MDLKLVDKRLHLDRFGQIIRVYDHNAILVWDLNEEVSYFGYYDEEELSVGKCIQFSLDDNCKYISLFEEIDIRSLSNDCLNNLILKQEVLDDSPRRHNRGLGLEYVDSLKYKS